MLYVFLALFAFHFVLERALSVLNIRHIAAHGGEVPEQLRGKFDAEMLRRSSEYTFARAMFAHVSAAFDAVVTLAFLLSGFLPWLDAKVGEFGFAGLTHGVVFLGVFIVLNSLLSVPFSIYSTFVIEQRFGFNKMTLSTFILDRVKGLALAALLGVPFLYALLAFMTRTGKFYWLYAAIFMIVFQFLLMVLIPLVIAPLFNKFTPLEEGELKRALEELAQRCRFAARGIFLMDGSKRSAHSNAYFTGLGKARRIVLFDTLVQQLTVAELSAVLAHEIGHYKLHHIPKMLVLSCVFTLGGFYVLSLLLDWPPLFTTFGFAHPSAHAGLLLFSLLAGTFTFWLGPLMNALSRKHEYEADAYSREQSGSADPLESALVKLTEKNLSTLNPHPAYSAYHYSHPTLAERVEKLKSKSTTERTEITE